MKVRISRGISRFSSGVASIGGGSGDDTGGGVAGGGEAGGASASILTIVSGAGVDDSGRVLDAFVAFVIFFFLPCLGDFGAGAGVFPGSATVVSASVDFFTT
jgi:hypothetical protein